jgi:hypothetical protein
MGRRGAISLLAVAALVVGVGNASAATYPANPGSLGPIPGSGGACGGGGGAPRNVTFNVSGLTVAPTNVHVTFTLESADATVGDLVVELLSPIGERHTIMGRTGAVTGEPCGDSSILIGPYTFSDLATAPPHGGWWQAAAATGSFEAVPSGTYRSTNSGGEGATAPLPPTSITPSFAGTANRGGEWTLRFTNVSSGGFAAVAAATLDISTTPVLPPVLPPVTPPVTPPVFPPKPPTSPPRVAPDTDPPQTKIKKRPENKTGAIKAKFKFSSDEPDSIFQCSLNGSKFKRCRSPKTVTADKGKNTFRVRAKDLAGNLDRTPAKDSWRMTGVQARRAG